MIYELRLYTLVPGKQAEYLALSRNVGRKVRGDRYGKFEGGWTTEFGTLNRYVHLWSYADLGERDRLRSELAANPEWKDYAPRLRPFILSQKNRLLVAVDGVPFTPPADGGKHVYELRTYRAQAGLLPSWISLFKGILPTREKYSKLVGLWSTDVGGLNQAVHLWAYRDLNQRLEARAAAAQDPEFQAFVGQANALLTELQSVVLMPTETSPLQ